MLLFKIVVLFHHISLVTSGQAKQKAGPSSSVHRLQRPYEGQLSLRYTLVNDLPSEQRYPLLDFDWTSLSRSKPGSAIAYVGIAHAQFNRAEP